MKTIKNDTPVYSIGKTAKMLNVSVQTLRLYEREGLIIPFKSPGNQRIYSIEDVERLRCIRRSINEEKVSIGGMKRIYGLIPCYDIVKCSQEERANCPVFKSHSGGCWTFEHTHSVCATKDCRTCDVYKLSSDCGQIKELIFRSSATPQPVIEQRPL